MNKTNELGLLLGISCRESADRILAQKYFKTLYGNEVDYLPETDSFLYRGIEFDYFKSGFSMEDENDVSFLLVDKENKYLWVFTYGDQEERWESYCSYKFKK